MSRLTNTVTAMLNTIAIAIFTMATASCGTTKISASASTNVAKLQDSMLVDTDGNKYRIKLLLDGNLWMTSNLKLNIPQSYCYDDARQHCEQYGRLYLWESAKQGCTLLGENWRLPASAEWRQLSLLYGANAEDSNVSRKAAYKALLDPGTSGFNALLGGGRAPDSQYARLNAHGFYWTATETHSTMACFYNFAKGSQALYQQDEGEKTRAFSVRCVKSIRNPQ